MLKWQIKREVKSMQASMDKFGRIVIPKQIREHLGWEIHSIIEIEEFDHQISLKAIDDQPKLMVESGILVFSGKANGDMNQMLSLTREERLKNLGNF